MRYAPLRRLTAPATANFFVAAVILALFVLAAVVSAERKDITPRFRRGGARLLCRANPARRRRLAGAGAHAAARPANFPVHRRGQLSQSPAAVLCAAGGARGRRLEGHPQALLAHRLIDVAHRRRRALPRCSASASPRDFRARNSMPTRCRSACIPVLVPIAGAVNNDNLAFLGGAVATLGVWQLVATGRDGWLARGAPRCGRGRLGEADRAFADRRRWSSAVIAYLLWRRRLRWSWAASPPRSHSRSPRRHISIFILQYGSPTPQTPAQIALLARRRARRRLGRPAAQIVSRAISFISSSPSSPTGCRRSARAASFNYAMLAVPVAALGCAFAGIALSLRRLWRRQETRARRRRDRRSRCDRRDFRDPRHLQLRPLCRDRMADGRLSALLPAARRNRAARRSVACRRASKRRAGAARCWHFSSPVRSLFRIFGAPLG